MDYDTTTVATSSLDLYPGNPRRGDIDAIKESLEVNGQYRPLVVSRRTMQVLAGNYTLTAARELGWTEIAVVLLDVDDGQARRIVLVDNKTGDLAENDSAALLELLDSLEGLDATGYDERAVDELLDELQPPPLDEEEIPSPPSELASPSSRPAWERCAPARGTAPPSSLLEASLSRRLAGRRHMGPSAYLLTDQRVRLMTLDSSRHFGGWQRRPQRPRRQLTCERLCLELAVGPDSSPGGATDRIPPAAPCPTGSAPAGGTL